MPGNNARRVALALVGTTIVVLGTTIAIWQQSRARTQAETTRMLEGFASKLLKTAQAFTEHRRSQLDPMLTT